MVARLMRNRFVPSCAAVVALMLGVGGCDKIDARRTAREAAELYRNGKYAQAAELYEASVRTEPNNWVLHHNLGVSYYKLLTKGAAGDTGSAENKQIADKAAEHLLTYLEHNPRETNLRKVVTDIWVESGQMEKAVALWEAEYRKDERNRDVIETIADLIYKKGDWRGAIGWLEKSIAVAPDPDSQASGFLKIGRLCWLKLFNHREGTGAILGAERVLTADIGIGAVQRGLALAPGNGDLVSTLGSLYQQRAMASGSRLGFHLDLASHQHQMRVLSVLKEAQKKQQADQPPAGPAPAGAAGGGGG